jgi:hypothetical protein
MPVAPVPPVAPQDPGGPLGPGGPGGPRQESRFRRALEHSISPKVDASECDDDIFPRPKKIIQHRWILKFMALYHFIWLQMFHHIMSLSNVSMSLKLMCPNWRFSGIRSSYLQMDQLPPEVIVMCLRHLTELTDIRNYFLAVPSHREYLFLAVTQINSVNSPQETPGTPKKYFSLSQVSKWRQLKRLHIPVLVNTLPELISLAQHPSLVEATFELNTTILSPVMIPGTHSADSYAATILSVNLIYLSHRLLQPLKLDGITLTSEHGSKNTITYYESSIIFNTHLPISLPIITLVNSYRQLHRLGFDSIPMDFCDDTHDLTYLGISEIIFMQLPFQWLFKRVLSRYSCVRVKTDVSETTPFETIYSQARVNTEGIHKSYLKALANSVYPKVQELDWILLSTYLPLIGTIFPQIHSIVLCENQSLADLIILLTNMAPPNLQQVKAYVRTHPDADVITISRGSTKIELEILPHRETLMSRPTSLQRMRDARKRADTIIEPLNVDITQMSDEDYYASIERFRQFRQHPPSATHSPAKSIPGPRSPHVPHLLLPIVLPPASPLPPATTPKLPPMPPLPPIPVSKLSQPPFN